MKPEEHGHHAAKIALREFGIEAIALPVPVADSVLNQNYRVETSSGAVFLRAHRASRPLERLEREQAAAIWCGERGLPTPVPRRATDGRTIVSVEGQFWSVYSWIDGHTYQRGTLTTAQASSLGVVHGWCIDLLKDFPVDGLPANSELTWSTEATLRALEELAPHVAGRGTEQERRWHATQLRLMQSPTPRPASDFVGLPVQATHGDFHERNVMFEASGNVAAVVDWERFCVQPPAFEVLRAISFMLIMDDAPLRAYLRGFRSRSVLAPETIRPCVEGWWQSSLHNTWAFRDYFLGGNEASRQFLPEEEGRSLRFNDSAFRERLIATLLECGC